jgi:uncharacterized protein YbjQ (UPF0145 family)
MIFTGIAAGMLRDAGGVDIVRVDKDVRASAIRSAQPAASVRWKCARRTGSVASTMADAAHAPAGLPMTTGQEFSDRQVTETLGVIYGLVVRSMGVVGGVAAGFKALRRGEVSQYTQLLEDSRRHAIDRMVDNARLVGADGLIAVRFDSSEIGQQLTEIVAYGTAVKLAPRV